MNNLAQQPQQSQQSAQQNASALTSQKMGRMLVESGKITAADLKSIMTIQTQRGIRFGEAAVLLGLVTADDIRTILAEQFAYTAVPDSRSRLHPSLSAAFRPDGPEAEALRSLRSELMLRYFNTAPHLSLTVVGADDAEAIAQTTANLAIAFSQLGLRTLLIDGNLRDPQMHNLFGIGNRHPGLSDLLAGRAQPQPIAVSPLHSLWLLHSGTQAPNPQELLTNRNYRARMEQLTDQFDVTLISTPPMGRTRDGQMVAAQSGAALLVAKQDRSRTKDIEAMCASLWGVGVRLLGVALHQ